MVTTASSVLHWLLASTLISEFFLLGIPLIFILYFHLIAGPRYKYFWLGAGLATLTGIKFIFLLGTEKMSALEPFYSLGIFIFFETGIRLFLHHERYKISPKQHMIFFISGYLFMKALALALFQFFTFTATLSYLTNPKLYALLDFQSISHPSLYISMVLHNIGLYGYLVLLFLLLLWQTKPDEDSIPKTFGKELICILVQSLYLFASHFSTTRQIFAPGALLISLLLTIATFIVSSWTLVLIRKKSLKDEKSS